MVSNHAKLGTCAHAQVASSCPHLLISKDRKLSCGWETLSSALASHLRAIWLPLALLSPRRGKNLPHLPRNFDPSLSQHLSQADRSCRMLPLHIGMETAGFKNCIDVLLLTFLGCWMLGNSLHAAGSNHYIC